MVVVRSVDIDNCVNSIIIVIIHVIVLYNMFVYMHRGKSDNMSHFFHTDILEEPCDKLCPL